MTLEERIMARAKAMPIEHETEWEVTGNRPLTQVTATAQCICGYYKLADFKRTEIGLARNWAKAAAEIHKEDNS
ncbi:hypothetical protein [Kocuria massiliensis]|uniref:hypothetical protein n=1 Tax=Kocuria massiliensis TaxID=1926282 RepID=UPI0022B9A749|nr:hypothetical protein [Kocuria massiliensis]